MISQIEVLTAENSSLAERLTESERRFSEKERELGEFYQQYQLLYQQYSAVQHIVAQQKEKVGDDDDITVSVNY